MVVACNNQVDCVMSYNNLVFSFLAWTYMFNRSERDQSGSPDLQYKNHHGPIAASSSMISFRTLRASAPVLRRTQVLPHPLPHLIEVLHTLFPLKTLDPRHPRAQKQDIPPCLPLRRHRSHETRVRRRYRPPHRQRRQIPFFTGLQTLWRDQNPGRPK